MTLFLLREQPDSVRRMTDAIDRLKTDIKYCKTCGNVSDADICEICASVNRDKSTVCVVKDFQDIIAIENTGQYSGVYHVLGGVISPMDGVGPDDININGLINRIADGGINELLFALSANMEGDTTAFYITKKVANYQIKITAISRGIAVGGELEYADEITLGRSILNRTLYSGH